MIARRSSRGWLVFLCAAAPACLGAAGAAAKAVDESPKPETRRTATVKSEDRALRENCDPKTPEAEPRETCREDDEEVAANALGERNPERRTASLRAASGRIDSVLTKTGFIRVADNSGTFVTFPEAVRETKGDRFQVVDRSRKGDQLPHAGPLNGTELRTTHEILARLGLEFDSRAGTVRIRKTPFEAPSAGGEMSASLSPSLMPSFLKKAARFLGRPLTDEEESTIIERLPLGKYVTEWRVHHLWRQGVTGNRRSMAVIDTGLPDDIDAFGGRIGLRRDMLPETPYDPKKDKHGTLAYAALTMAPELTINSYRAFADGHSTAEALHRAFAQAIEDGNDVIAMAVVGPYDPGLARLVQLAHERGITIVAAAGNEGRHGPKGVSYPCGEPGVICSGALTFGGDMDRVTSYGPNRLPGPQPRGQPLNTRRYFQPLLFAPGEALSPQPPADGRRNEWAMVRGTSVATFFNAGVAALLAQRAADLGIDPHSVRDAFMAGTAALPRKALPVDFPAEQPALIVDPIAAAGSVR